jgi:hypothetical protein
MKSGWIVAAAVAAALASESALPQQRFDGMLIVQGFESSRAFSVTISEANGKLVGAIAADEEWFMNFGACTPL